MINLGPVANFLAQLLTVPDVVLDEPCPDPSDSPTERSSAEAATPRQASTPELTTPTSADSLSDSRSSQNTSAPGAQPSPSSPEPDRFYDAREAIDKAGARIPNEERWPDPYIYPPPGWRSE